MKPLNVASKIHCDYATSLLTDSTCCSHALLRESAIINYVVISYILKELKDL